MALSPGHKLKRVGAVGILVLTLSACATANVDQALTDVNDLVEERTTHKVAWHRDDASREQASFEMRQLLAQPLTPDSAIKIAFLRNSSIQSNLGAIGIAESDVAQAGRMRNPVISIGRIAGDGILEIERQILFSVLSLFTIGPRTEIAKDQAERARYLAALDVVKSAGDVRTAWIEAVAARERVQIMKRAFSAARSAEELGMRMAAAGSMPALDQAKLKVAKAEAAAQLGKLRVASAMAREKLIREMGVWGKETKFSLPSRLPKLPARTTTRRNMERTALLKRLDIRAARKEVELLKKTKGLTQFTSVVSLLEISGFANDEREPGEEADVPATKNHLHGFEVEFAVPIFDLGDAKVDRAKYTYMQAVEQLKSLAVTARSEVREAYTGYRGAYDLARHYKRTIVPLNTRITEEELLRYNGMLASVFDLLNANKQKQMSLMTALDARRDFWLSKARLNYVLAAGSSSGASMNVEVAEAGSGDEEH